MARLFGVEIPRSTLRWMGVGLQILLGLGASCIVKSSAFAASPAAQYTVEIWRAQGQSAQFSSAELVGVFRKDQGAAKVLESYIPPLAAQQQWDDANDGTHTPPTPGQPYSYWLRYVPRYDLTASANLLGNNFINIGIESGLSMSVSLPARTVKGQSDRVRIRVSLHPKSVVGSGKVTVKLWAFHAFSTDEMLQQVDINGLKPGETRTQDILVSLYGHSYAGDVAFYATASIVDESGSGLPVYWDLNTKGSVGSADAAFVKNLTSYDNNLPKNLTATNGNFPDKIRISWTHVGEGYSALVEPVVGLAEQPPVISSIAQTQRNVVRGENVTFTVAATPDDVSYQWYQDGVAISGQTSKSLAFTSITLADGAYTYRVDVGNKALSTPVSASVQLVVGSNAASSGGASTPAGFSRIPTGTFIMGDSKKEGYSGELPTHSVTVSAFFIQQTETTYTQWKDVYDWNSIGNRGYDFDAGQRGESSSSSALADSAVNNTNPVSRITWWDAVKWCNAKSRKEGMAPCYYTDTGLGVELKSGTSTTVYVNWSADGYRLPTEAEWEYAARGGLVGKSYPWGDGLTASQANYAPSGSLFGHTTPVGFFNGGQTPAGVDMKNGYGLYDIAGNVWELCWDWYDNYTSAAQLDPRGPASGTLRVLRGGSIDNYALDLRVAVRARNAPNFRGHAVGLRPARSLVSIGGSSTTVPIAPSALSSSALSDTNFSLSWLPVNDVTRYEIFLYSDSAFTQTIPSYNPFNNGTAIQKIVTGLLPNTTYYARVRAVVNNQNSPTSDLTVYTRPSAPVAKQVAVSTRRAFKAEWNPVSSATSYRLDVAIDNAFNQIIWSVNDLNVGNATSYDVQRLDVGRTYYYRVRAVTATGTSLNSNVISFALPADPPPVPEVTYVAVEVPNGVPATSATTTSRYLTLNLATAGPAPDQYQVSERSDFAGASWQPFTPYPQVELSSASGTKTIYIQLKSGSAVSTPASVQVTFNPPSSYAAISSPAAEVAPDAGTGQLRVAANSSWTATTTASWITITSGGSGSNDGTVSYSLAANTTNQGRTGTITVGGQTFTIYQSSGTASNATVTLSSSAQSAAAASGTGSIGVTASGSWTATTSASWITITSGNSGTGNGTISYTLAANTTSAARSGTITVGGVTYTVNQAAEISSGAVTTSGLVAYYPLNGDANDASSNRNHGALKGALTFGDGKAAQAAKFDGSSAYVEVPASESLNLTKAMTVAFWMRIEGDNPTGSRRIFDKTHSNQADGYAVNYYAARGRVEIDLLVPGENGVAAPVINYAINDWVHIAITVGDGTQALYRNGTEVFRGPATQTIPKNSLPLIIGAAQNGEFPFIGSLDEFRLYNRVLTAQEIASLMQPPVALPPAIAAQPSGATVAAGGSLTLNVSASGTGPFTYQWRKDGVPISGATSASYSISSVRPFDAGNYSVIITSNAGTTASAIAAVVVPSSRLVNLSILTNISAGDSLFTVGTVVGGVGTSGSKALLVRAAGPSLAPLGVSGTLSDPKLDLFSGQTVVVSNDNWGGSSTLNSAFDQVGAFGYVSATSKDAAVFSETLATGGYTVQVSGIGGGTGAVIAEIYDATPSNAFSPTTPRIINVSVLKQIGSGSTLTAGFVIGGSTTMTVLIRAVGPGLTQLGVNGVMSDPKVDLFRGQTGVATNDNWGTPSGTTATTAAQLTNAFTQVGAFALPTGSRDAALLVTLAPGNYTAQVSGVNNSNGFAIVEIYEVP